MSSRPSVVIRSKDEADRLRLTLASLAVQTETAEIVVVDDGSSDHTADVINAARRELDLVAIRHPRALGRSNASNAGAARASGDVLIFLDGDTLVEPNFVERHMELHRRNDDLILRGDTRHLRCTRFFLDPETGTPRPGEEARVQRMSEVESAHSLVTRKQIVEDFAMIDRRSQEGIYPGHGPRLIYRLEMEALIAQSELSVLWAAASGANQSVGRAVFLEAGGFLPNLTINEHRELALRLCGRGLRMAPCAARSYHLTHRTGWRDPLADQAWEEIFYGRHPLPEVALLPVLWASLSDAGDIPESSKLLSLADLARAARRCEGVVGRSAVREEHMRLTCGSLAEPAKR